MKWLPFLLILLVSCQNNKDSDTRTNSNFQDTVALPATAKEVDVQVKSTPDTAWLIIPGKRVGHVLLGESANALDVLGKPDLSDAAMGKAWLTWKGKPDEHNKATELNIYTTYKDNSMKEKTVQQIRTTSSSFYTPDSLHVYSSLVDIKSKLHSVTKIATYKEDNRFIAIYDAVQDGIAFEIADADTQQLCTGIIIHKKGQKATETYIMLHPDMKKL